jgi:hypothetical protein
VHRAWPASSTSCWLMNMLVLLTLPIHANTARQSVRISCCRSCSILSFHTDCSFTCLSNESAICWSCLDINKRDNPPNQFTDRPFVQCITCRHLPEAHCPSHSEGANEPLASLAAAEIKYNTACQFKLKGQISWPDYQGPGQPATQS